MKKILALLTLMFLLTSCFGGKKDVEETNTPEVTTPEISGEETDINTDEETSTETETSTKAPEVTTPEPIEEDASLETSTSTETGAETDTKTEEEIVDDFEKELDSLFDLLEDDA